MRQYIARRLLLMIPTLFIITLLVFVMMRVVPGDITMVMLGGEAGGMTPEAMAILRHRLGLDLPIHQQYLNWMSDILRFDLGDSLWSDTPIAEEFARRFPITLQLAVMATCFSVISAIPLGVLCAIRQDAWLDYVFRTFAISGLSIPAFWLGLMIILFLSIVFGWMPPLGYISIFDDPFGNLQQLIWPALAVAYRHFATTTRMTRSCMLEVMREDYIRTARAKGLRERVVIYRHALKNSLLPVVTVIGMEFALLIGGLVVTETVFSLPGLARFLVDSIFYRDYTAVQDIVLLIATIVVVANLVVDLLYGWLDPRIRYT